VFADLGHQPPSNALLTKEQLLEPEIYYPLTVYWCEKCLLVQVPEFKKATEIFDETYPYYSSQSPSNVSHAKEFCEIMMERFRPKTVLEIGSNDGYMLKFFKDRGCDVVGVDPASGPAKYAIKKGIPTFPGFFSSDLFHEMLLKGKKDLICGINVLAHQPDIHDFVEGLKLALAPSGVCVFEFPWLLDLVDGNQWDTIYHEHYNYYSFTILDDIFTKHGLCIFDVDHIPEHGGSLRIYATHLVKKDMLVSSDTISMLSQESIVQTIEWFQHFNINTQIHIKELKRKITLLSQEGMICAYGAAAKGNTLLNTCRFTSRDIQFVIDRSPHKQGKFMPGSHICIVGESVLKMYRPAYVLLLPWNIKDEIMNQLSYIREWNGRFIIPIPEAKVI